MGDHVSKALEGSGTWASESGPAPFSGLITHCAVVPTFCSNWTDLGFHECIPIPHRPNW